MFFLSCPDFFFFCSSSKCVWFDTSWWCLLNQCPIIVLMLSYYPIVFIHFQSFLFGKRDRSWERGQRRRHKFRFCLHEVETQCSQGEDFCKKSKWDWQTNRQNNRPLDCSFKFSPERCRLNLKMSISRWKKGFTLQCSYNWSLVSRHGPCHRTQIPAKCKMALISPTVLENFQKRRTQYFYD